MEMSIKEMMNLGFDKTFEDDTRCYGFYDWFCHTKSLKNKAKRLFSTAMAIAKNTKKFDIEKCYVFFKNNCPCYGDGRLYDDIRICDIASGDVIYNICPRDPYGKTMLYFEGHGFDAETEGIEFSSLVELRKWFRD